MKKHLAVLLALVLALALVGCASAKTVTLALPFSAEAVESLVLTCAACGSEEAQSCSLDDPESIRAACELFEGLSLEEKQPEPVEGATTYTFLFRLSDGTEYDLVYTGYGVKNGTLSSVAGDFIYFTSADLGGYWEGLVAA